MLRNLIIVLTLTSNWVFGEKFKFSNYSLYRVEQKNEEQVKLLQDLDRSDKYDFWTEPTSNRDHVLVMSSPKDKGALETFLSLNNFDFEVTFKNIQELVEKESVKAYTRNNLRSMQWDAYYTLDDIYSWLDDLIATYPSIVTRIIGGYSYEGRDIIGIKISHGPGKKSIFIEGGIHAREWISPAVVNYITNELLTSNDKETMAAARDFDWYIFPVTNPDGYVWTFDGYRLWRKNRQPYGDQFGVDLNRNWNSNWLLESVSVNPASNTYAGPGPFSEPETRSLSAYVRTLAKDMEMYLSFHSAGQILLLPFGNTTDPLANYYDAMRIGRRAMGALSVRYGTVYTSGNIAEAIYHATGTSVDWVKEHLNVPLVYCYELRDRGTYGHMLPADQILASGEETMDSVMDLIYQAKRFGYMKN